MRLARLLCTLSVAAASCDEPTEIVQRTTTACHHVSLVDQESGTVVRGTEDLVGGSDFFFVSTYDRWKAESAVREYRSQIPGGALYLLPVSQELFSTNQISVSALPVSEDLDLRPHGIDFLSAEEGGGSLAVINRRYIARKDPASHGWQVETTLELFHVEGHALVHRETIRSELICRANDISALNANEFLLTRDHGACKGSGVMLENTFGLKKGKVVHVSTDPNDEGNTSVTIIADGLGYPNGVAIDHARGYAHVSATREQAIYSYAVKDLLDQESAEPLSRMGLPASPDNLTLLPNGNLLVAAHPSPLRIGLYRNRWLGVTTAPSQIFSVDPANKKISQLFDDSSGELLSAATSALIIENHLIAGSVADEGLLVCRLAQKPFNDSESY